MANRVNPINPADVNMKVNIAGVEFNNPVTVASGTFGSGMEYCEYVDLNKLGAVTTKGVANVPWPGNPTPRIAETYGGMINAIGLQNPGLDTFVKRDIPFLKQYDTKIIVNVCGKTEEDYVDAVEKLGEQPVDMLEINISCPNVKEGGIAFGQVPASAERITKAVKKVAKQPVIMKLSPNVTDITEMAKAVEAGGADAVSLINTLTGMKIDINRRTFAVANKTGGLSGPAIKPVAVRMVYQVANAVALPIIGMGGIANADDALEFIMAGATMVSVGTANFNDPLTTIKVVDGTNQYSFMIDELQRDTFAPKSLSDIEKYFITKKQLELEKEKQLLAQRAYDKIVARERQEQQRKQEAEEALIEEALRESKLYQTVLSIAWIQMFLIPIILIPCYLFSDEFNNNGWKDRISLIMVLAFLGVLLFVIISFFILDPIKNRIIKRIKENNIHNS